MHPVGAMSKNEPRELATRMASGIRAFSGADTKHAELSGWLRHAIASGQYKAGDKLPTEAAIVASTPYSLGTVQRAIRTLVEEGLVERRRRLGTFVTQPRRRIDEPWHFRFLDDDRRTLLPVFPKVLARTEFRQRGPWNDYLNASPLLRIDRLVNVNDEFAAYSRFLIDPARFPLFTQVPVDSLHGANFRALLNSQLPDPVERICHRIAMAPPAPEAAREAGIAPGQICSIVEIAAAARGDDFVYYQELTVPPSGRRLALVDPMAV